MIVGRCPGIGNHFRAEGMEQFGTAAADLAEADNTDVLYFRNATATFASFGGAPRTVTF